MFKMVLSEYFHNYNLKNKELKKLFSMMWPVIYIMLFPLFFQSTHKVAEDIIRYYFSMVPLIFAIIQSALNDEYMPEMMYICPFTDEERKKYQKYKQYIMFCIPMLLSTILIVAEMVCNILSLITGIYLLILFVAAYAMFTVNKIFLEKRGILILISSIDIAMPMLITLFLKGEKRYDLFYEIENISYGLAVSYIISFLILAVLIVLTWIYVKRYSDFIDKAVSYEEVLSLAKEADRLAKKNGGRI